MTSDQSFLHTTAGAPQRTTCSLKRQTLQRSEATPGLPEDRPLKGGRGVGRTFQRTQFFENIERDNEVKKKEIRLVYIETNEFFRLDIGTAISNRQTSIIKIL